MRFGVRVSRAAPALRHLVYKTIELTGSSTTTIEDAISGAIAKASKTIAGGCGVRRRLA